MKYYIYIDVGSSTIKTYARDASGAVGLVDEKSILFKDGFTPGAGVAPEKIDALYSHFRVLAERFGIRADNARTLATGIWREAPDAQIAEIRARLPAGFDVISHETEARYLKQAAELDYGGKKVLVINMGGRTTEIATFWPDGATKTQLLNAGVADLLNRFPAVNDPIAAVDMGDMESFVAGKLDGLTFDADYDFALFTGELRFEKLSGYPLCPNTMFKDANHPFMLSIDDFVAGTRRIFYDMTMGELRALMPHNPDWMTGARPGGILPLAIFHRANIKIIVPSDLNLINGVIKDDA